MNSRMTILVTVLFSFLGTLATAQPGHAQTSENLSETDLLERTTWLDQVKDYDVHIQAVLGTPGAMMEFGIELKGLAPYCSATTLTVMGTHLQGQCDGDSLWSIQPSFGTYSVDPFQAVALAGAEPSLDEMLKKLPFPFGAFRQFLTVSPGEALFERAGQEELELNGQPILCEVWNQIPDPDQKGQVRYWLDPERGTVLKTLIETRKGLQDVRSEIRVTHLLLDQGLTPADFRFTPTAGFRRVANPAKMLVASSMEGQTIGELHLADLAGNAVSSTEWSGKIVVLDFWATWCAPCKKTLPHLRHLAETSGDDVVVVGITGEEAQKVASYFQADPSPYPILIDSGQTAHEAYKVENLPTLFVLDRSGKILDHFVGYLEENVLLEAVEAARIR